MLCASAPGKDTCQGDSRDSGGSIIVTGVLVGTTSWGSGCADSRKSNSKMNEDNERVSDCDTYYIT
ncbi:hypothetical protein DAPPUDRAFT_247046 [Daphnia pulex]|uniref:Peptidase S1 domain-containing protein n=1 Tax=Daphnia pulex TaxID=6669 RepID=E9GRN7_DAPPU|nr:hypothetical protein DAPPUDRAFT_247046 [Daphnia pulex]|eukprot:EFX77880.1 hypothetical protein DAPPUDRAFT_247046 [Daphnia pulex]